MLVVFIYFRIKNLLIQRADRNVQPLLDRRVHLMHKQRHTVIFEALSETTTAALPPVGEGSFLNDHRRLSERITKKYKITSYFYSTVLLVSGGGRFM